MSTRIHNPAVSAVICTILGVILILIGYGIIHSARSNHQGWEEVQAEYREVNCHEETHYVKKSRKNVTDTYCDLMIVYGYNGTSYEQTIPNQKKSLFNPKTRLVDPEHPEESEEIFSDYIFGGICIFMAVLLLFGAVKSFRRIGDGFI